MSDDKQLEIGDKVFVEGEVQRYDVVTDSLLLQLVALPIEYTITVPSVAVIQSSPYTDCPPGSMGADSDAELEAIARVAHEINRVYCEALGDDSQPRWEEAPTWQRDSAVEGVAFHITNPRAGADASHENWFQHKVETGWRYGEVKDVEAKTHPCMVPFRDLPVEQQMKDHLFRACVHAAIHLIAEIDYASGAGRQRSRPHADEEEA